MRKSLILILTASVIVLTGCESANHQAKEEWPVDFEALVDLNCKAIKLRKARFATADSLRLKMDSLRLSMDSTEFKTFQSDFEKRKQLLLHETNILADSIRSKMKRVMSEVSPEEKRVFNDSLQAELKRAGCE